MTKTPWPPKARPSTGTTCVSCRAMAEPEAVNMHGLLRKLLYNMQPNSANESNQRESDATFIRQRKAENNKAHVPARLRLSHWPATQAAGYAYNNGAAYFVPRTITVPRCLNG